MASENVQHDFGINGWRGRLGFMVVSTDTTVESDTFRMVPYGVSVHFDRIALKAVTVKSLSEMIQGVETSAKLLAEAKLDAIAFACTSASVVIGDQPIIDKIRKAAPGTYATTIITAVVNALKAMQLKKISLLTPYIDEINRLEMEYLTERGFQVLDVRGMGITDDSRIARVSPDEIYRFVKDADIPESDGIFISCGNFRSSSVIDVLERDLNKPVITSNQAMIWDMLRHLRIPEPISGYGELIQSL
jgi:maleate isomerase